MQKNSVVKKFITSVPSSDRVIYLEFNSDNQLVGINFRQGLESIDYIGWQSNDPVLYAQLNCVSTMNQYTTDNYTLGMMAEILDSFIWSVVNILQYHQDEEYARRTCDKILNNWAE
jgi:hypothetical protein